MTGAFAVRGRARCGCVCVNGGGAREAFRPDFCATMWGAPGHWARRLPNAAQHAQTERDYHFDTQLADMGCGRAVRTGTMRQRLTGKKSALESTRNKRLVQRRSKISVPSPFQDRSAHGISATRQMHGASKEGSPLPRLRDRTRR
ncbi:hypothetical protein PAMC26510_10655 [Caballeronia sordidicola]|uniref:Uncharacterized protein n=1 Tax=Caballeronia sordidicola TaxID=196367 RepID=A0A242N140_CABSO|nr:hypothetical protein PAMC26510_10655 [Caballeronia sordidicola]